MKIKMNLTLLQAKTLLAVAEAVNKALVSDDDNPDLIECRKLPDLVLDPEESGALIDAIDALKHA